MKLKPLFDRVIVKSIEEKSISKSGLVLPSTAQEKPLKGKIIETPLNDENKNSSKLKKGDTVLFHKYAASEFEFEGEKFLILKQDDVLAKIEE